MHICIVRSLQQQQKNSRDFHFLLSPPPSLSEDSAYPGSFDSMKILTNEWITFVF